MLLWIYSVLFVLKLGSKFWGTWDVLKMHHTPTLNWKWDRGKARTDYSIEFIKGDGGAGSIKQINFAGGKLYI